MSDQNKYQHQNHKALSVIVVLLIACISIMVYTIYMIDKMNRKFEMTKTGSDVDERYEAPTLENSLDTLILLEQNTWTGLSEETRISVLQKITDIEQLHLGLPDKMTVKVDDLSGIHLGEYTDSDHCIRIDRTQLKEQSSYVLCEAILHEVYHNLEYRMVDVYDDADAKLKQLPYMRAAETYKYEFANYIDCNDDMENYRKQTCEIDSNAYAAERVELYITLVTDAAYGVAAG